MLLAVLVGGLLVILAFTGGSVSSAAHRRIEADERVQLSAQETRRIEAVASRRGSKPAPAIEAPKQRLARVHVEGGPIPTIHTPSTRLPVNRRRTR